MHYKEFFNAYMSAAEFAGRPRNFTLAGIEKKTFTDEKRGKTEDRAVVHVKETPAKFVCNRTNLESLAHLFGAETDKWMGRRVTLTPAKVNFGSSVVDGIRVLGSPEIDKPVEFELRLPRKKPATVTLVPTDKETGRPRTALAPTRDPGSDDGEVR